MSRREAMKLLAASAVLAGGLVGCTRKPPRKIVSLAETPEYQKPGCRSTTRRRGPKDRSVRDDDPDGRRAPGEDRGAPAHPLNPGTSSAPMQASILSLYDPDRMQFPKQGKDKVAWAEADRRVVEALRKSGSTVLITRSSIGPCEQAMVGGS